MTLKVKLSALKIEPEAFAARVTAFVVAMKEYAAHLEGVKIDAANPDLKPEDRRVAFPPPSEDDLIARAAHEGYEFEGPSLDEKKQVLFAKLAEKERDAHERIDPARKQRHLRFMVHDANARKAKGVATDEDDAILTAATERGQHATAVQRWAAKHEHDISDLTDETVDHYVIGGEFA